MSNEFDVKKYYQKGFIRKEIVDFLRKRWVAVHCKRLLKDGRPILVRYISNVPIKVESQGDLDRILKRLAGLGPRTFYGSANIYRKLETREDALEYFENVETRTPTWDIDSRPEWWKTTLEVARAIVDVLEKEGVTESVWLKWSGRGMHIHVNEHAFSPELLAKNNPLDVSWAVVQYVINKLQNKLLEINMKKGTEIKVENLMDPQRVFTAPLSLHRTLNVACVPFKPEDIDAFQPEWTNPLNPHYRYTWRKYEIGELDPLAEKALKVVGGYNKPAAQRRTKPLTPPTPLKQVAVIKYAPPVPLRPELLRLNPAPAPLEGRDLRLNPQKAVTFLEDILSSYALGRLSLEQALGYINACINVTLRAQGYSEDDVKALIALYSQAARKLLELKDPDKVKKWLLSHGKRSELQDKF